MHIKENQFRLWVTDLCRWKDLMPKVYAHSFIQSKSKNGILKMKK